MTKTKDQQAQEYADRTIASFGDSGVPCGIKDIKQMIADGYVSGYTAAEQSMWRSMEEKEKKSRFKVGDNLFHVFSPTVKHKCTVTKVVRNEHSGKWEYDVLYDWGKPGMYIPESDLETDTNTEKV